MQKVRPIAFYPPVIFLILTVLFSLFGGDNFGKLLSAGNSWVIANIGWGFSLTGLLTVFGVIAAYFSPFGNIRIGGKNAVPPLNKWRAFSITLCTTVAAGLAFWGAAEPIYHLSSPPASLKIDPLSAESVKFAMETVYLHWVFTPYAIYTLPTIVFAFVYFNMKKPFSIASMLAPLLGKYAENATVTQTIDAVCLFGFAAGMAGSMGTNTLILSGGVNSITDVSVNSFLYAIIITAVIILFVASSATGLLKGIRILSDINMKSFVVLLVFFLLVGPVAYMFNLGVETFGGYLTNFFDKSLFTGAYANDQWPQWWTVFYWGSWMAWAPMVGCFLGRVAYGYTVKEVIRFTFFWPSLFSAFWMTVFSTTCIWLQFNTDVDLVGILKETGPEAVLYALLNYFPGGKLLSIGFFFVVFLCFVTAADSTTNAMAAISTSGITPENPEAPLYLKVLWGAGMGVICFATLNAGKIDAVKQLSNIGGVAAAVMEFATFLALWMIISNHNKYNKTEM